MALDCMICCGKENATLLLFVFVNEKLTFFSEYSLSYIQPITLPKLITVRAIHTH